MSIRTNPMKAVPVLLKRLKTAKSKFHQSRRDESLDGKLEKLTRELNKIEDLFVGVKKNQDELLDTLHEVDGHLRKLDRKKLNQDMDSICRRIRDCAHKLLPMDTFEFESCDNKSDETVESISHDPLLLPQPQHINPTPEIIRSLADPLPYYISSLMVFPEDAVINRTRHTIYWWIGEHILNGTEHKTAQEICEVKIDGLLKLNLIVPHGNGKCPLVNKFKLSSHFRHILNSSADGENVDNLGYYHKTRL